MRSDKTVRWLQLSDLHIFYSTEWELMVKGYEELATVFKPDFIVVTGDFRHIKEQKSYKSALDFLNKIAEIFSVKKKDFFFVPGNHDVQDFNSRDEIICKIRSEIETNSDYYQKYKLLRAFKNYDSFIRSFYAEALNKNDERVKNPSDVFSVLWKRKINIVVLNSALISNSVEGGCEIIDINKLTQVTKCLDTGKPTIVLAHHSPEALARSHKTQLSRILPMINARAYLCGDAHKVGRDIANKFDINNQTVAIVCGKSAVEVGDHYSDVCVIGYTWSGSQTNVEVFKWLGKDSETPYQFIKSDLWYHHIDKPFSFKMTDAEVTSPSKTSQIESIWKTFLTIFKEEDILINQKNGSKGIKNKNGNYEKFSSEKIMRSLITIGIPFPAVSEITKKSIDAILDIIGSDNSSDGIDTKTIRLKVLEAIRSLDVKKWDEDKVSNWCTRYIRRYGHNNRIIQLCNIPPELNCGMSINDANYKFIKDVFLPDLFHEICPKLLKENLSSSQINNLAEEVLAFINECDLYYVDYNVLKQIVKEIATKPPHPWIIYDSQRQEMIDYDKHAVETNLKELLLCEKNKASVPYAVFIELLHHTSAMMLDRYFSFFGCEDLDAFYILTQYFKKMIDVRFSFKNWDLMLDNAEIKGLIDDFALHGINISEYYAKMCAINPQKIMIQNTNHTSAIKEFANESLRIINCFNERSQSVRDSLISFASSDWKNYNKIEIDYYVGKILSSLFPSDFTGDESKAKSVWWMKYASCYSSEIENMKNNVLVVMIDEEFEENMLCFLEGDNYKSNCNTIFFIKEQYLDNAASYIQIKNALKRLNLDNYFPVLFDKNDLLNILYYSGKKNICFDDIVRRQRHSGSSQNY